MNEASPDTPRDDGALPGEDREAVRTDRRRPQPIVATLWSIVAPGLGHFYAGDRLRGVLLLLLMALVAVPAALAVMAWALPHALWPISAALVALILAHIAVWIDAWRRASLAPPRPSAVRRGFVLPAVVMIAFSVGSSDLIRREFKQHFLQAYRIPTVGMVPALLQGDYILVDKRAYRNAEPAEGDVVVFLKEGRPFVKRITAVPGAKLDSDGEPIEEPAPGATKLQIYRAKGAHRLRPGEYFLMGDNRGNSLDSRHFGVVERERILGRAEWTYMSIDPTGWVRWDRIATRVPPWEGTTPPDRD